MTTKLPLTITQRGLAALIDASGGATNAVHLATMGLTDQPFITAPTLTSLPGEHTRLSTLSGNSVSENVIHMVATDASENTYTVTGIGLYLDTGELFGVFSLNAGDDALFEKSASATFLFAADVLFEGGQASLIQFGDANFLNPPATTDQKGVAYLATPAEVAAGVDSEKIVTPAALSGAFIPQAAKGAAGGVATLDASGRVPPVQLPPISSIDTFTAANEAAMLALAAAGPGDFCLRTDISKTYILTAAPASTLANWAEFLSPGAPVKTVNGRIGDVVVTAADVGCPPVSRKINVAGLIGGGGDLSVDRTITVNIASAADTLAGIINDSAVTPASLALVLASIGGKVAATRAITASGLATGGGTLDQNRNIDVARATAADVEGLVDNSKALTAAALAGTLRNISATGYLRIPGTPLIIQWGTQSFLGRQSGSGYDRFTQFKAFPFAFPNSCFQVLFSLTGNPDDNDDQDEIPWIANWQREGFTMAESNDWAAFSFTYLAIGI